MLHMLCCIFGKSKFELSEQNVFPYLPALKSCFLRHTREFERYALIVSVNKIKIQTIFNDIFYKQLKNWLSKQALIAKTKGKRAVGQLQTRWYNY